MRIGVVALDRDLQRKLRTEIEACGHEFQIFESLRQALPAEPELVFAEWMLGENLPDLLEGLRSAAAMPRPIPVVVLVPPGASTSMHRARSCGAADVLFSPPDAEEVRAEIQDRARRDEALESIDQQAFREMRRRKLVGQSPPFLRSLEELLQAARCDANVLLIGETGTGKEMFADCIHKLSRRSASRNVAINCASVPGTLLEAELFGHSKGAYTDARNERIGRFEAVGAGTLLLDEIGDIEPALQMKLLRVIDKRVFQRIGENKNTEFDARLICATSVDLEAAVSEGKFRQDLLGRIDQFRITLPPLRQRRDDVRILARHFAIKHAGGRLVEISKTAMEVLEAYDFPMNVRQLENAIVGALARSNPGRLILVKHLPPDMTAPKERRASSNVLTLNLPANLHYNDARDYAVRAVDGVYLNELLRKHNGNRTRAAEEAGVDRKTFVDRVVKALRESESGQHD